jgi:excisionase family DNA binding protein
VSAVTEPWLTKREVARKLQVSTRTVERLRLPAIRVGGQNRYRMSEVDRALAGTEDLPDNVVPLRPRRKRVVA